MDSYRPNVAAILRKPKSGQILVCQRRDHSGCWQFPQGGVDGQEDLIAALYREVEEEIGILPEKYTIHSCRTGYRYKFPNGHLKKGLFAGQEQTYFLCDYHGKKKEINLDNARWPSLSRPAGLPRKTSNSTGFPNSNNVFLSEFFETFFKSNCSLANRL